MLKKTDLPTVMGEWLDLARDLRERGWTEGAIEGVRPIFYMSMHLTVHMVVRAAQTSRTNEAFGEWLLQRDAEATAACAIARAMRTGRTYTEEAPPRGRRPWDPDGKVRSSLAGAAFVVLAVLAYGAGTLLDVVGHARSYCETQGYWRGPYDGLDQVPQHMEGREIIPMSANGKVGRAPLD